MGVRSATFLVALTVVVMVVGSCGEPGNDRRDQSVSAPFFLDHNRMIAEVEIGRPDGSRRTALAWIDTGNQFLIFSGELAEELGLDVSALDGVESARPVKISSPAPLIFLGRQALMTEDVAVEVTPGSQVWSGVPADLNLPATAFRGLHVVFDYPRMRVTAAKTGERQPRGTGIPCRIHPSTGLFQITATVDGKPVELGVDTGSAGMWVSKKLTDAIRQHHPGWRTATGAVGSANFFGFDFELHGTLMSLPTLEIGDSKVTNVPVLGLDQALFDWYSTKSAEPVVGIMGANVLKNFRLEVDYPSHMTYWDPGRRVAPGDLDIVGLTLRPEADGRFTVVGAVSKDGTPAVEGIEPGDILKSIGNLDVEGLSMGPVIDALRGMPGESRLLVVEREGRRLEIEAEVIRLP